MSRSPLPIDPFLPAVDQALREGTRLLVQAEPGAGKTTRIPPVLVDGGHAPAGRLASIVPAEQMVVVLEPRRIAARLASRRVAAERGGEVGQEVGYQVRFERRRSAQTRILFVTEGVLLRWLLDDPEIPWIGAVVLDEFHERSLEADLCLALLREIQSTIRSDLRLVVMSATLETDALQRYLDPAPVLTVPGREHPIEIDYLESAQPPPMEESVALAFTHLLEDGFAASVLVFVPGAGEIRRCLRTLDPLARKRGFDLFPLHGDLPPEEQERAIRPGARPRVIVSTNVAEASVTVDGVHAVIDSGRVRVARYDVWSGIDRLVTERVSRASAIQRAGRAGRLGPGRCIRLYRERELESFAAAIEPEIERIDLSGAVLAVKAWGDRALESFAWLTPPRPEALERARTLLQWIGALDDRERITARGRRLLRLPLPPRLARVLDAAHTAGVGAAGALAVALAEAGDLRRGTRTFGDGTRPPVQTAESDLLVLSDLFLEAEASRFERSAVARLGLDGRALWRAAQVRDQLRRVVEPQGPRPPDERAEG
ncbi:MAG: ATP-dependent RNA helicase, partial [Candidatus Eisenbacteria bacterium]|nr:ATP-dependent RNA helicase [Candidatus Eisenbacteria bacterium]